MFALELNYPQISAFGAPQVTSGTDIIGYVKYAFVFLVVAAGIFGVISIAISGFIILVSAGNPAAITAARERIFGSILGIGLLMFSYIILRTINPQIIGEEFRPDPTGAVYYIVDNPDWSPEFDDIVDKYLYKPAPTAEVDVFNNVVIGINSLWQYPQLYYSCNPNNPNPKSVLVWTYDKPDLKFSRDSNTFISDTEELPCVDIYPRFGSGGNVINLGWGGMTQSRVESFKWEYKKPGVYFYLKDNCKGISTSVQKVTGAIKKFDTTSQDQVPKSLKIVNGTGRKEKYGVVLTDKVRGSFTLQSGEVAECSLPLNNTSGIFTENIEDSCVTETNNTWPKKWEPFGSADDPNTLRYVAYSAGGAFQPVSAFILNLNPITDAGGWGAVTFWNDYKKITILPETIFSGIGQTNYNYTVIFRVVAVILGQTIDSSAIVHNFNKWFRYPDHPSSEYYAKKAGVLNNECANGRTCLRDITFRRGAYYVIIYSANSVRGDPTTQSCGVFNESVFDIKNEKFLKYSKDITKTIIVPSSNYLK